MVTETITTLDGKMHVLLGSTTLESIVREYAGDEAADAVRYLVEHDTYEEARADSDLDSYEASLDRWRSVAQDWIGEIAVTLRNSEKYTKVQLLVALRKLKENISNEL